MAHLIMKHDKGAVHGTTWHKLPQYEQLPECVSREKMRAIADYPMELVPSFVAVNGLEVPTGSRAIVRPDIGMAIVPSVGDDYRLENNLFLAEHIEKNFLDVCGDKITIESVGTLRNGATFFINLQVREFQIKGDRSNTCSYLMFSNPLGIGSYMTGVHNTRIVCNNTLRAAEAQAAANGSLFKIAHRSGAVIRISDALEQLAQFNLGLDMHIKKLNMLAERQVCSAEVHGFLEAMFPDNENFSLRQQNNVMEARRAVLEQFEKDQALDRGTAYAALNAFTYVTDHRRQPTKRSDEAQIVWDNLYGKQASVKEKALDHLLQLV